jgi:choline-glycine betaine transporter
MGFDWVFSNWELYFGLAVALAIALFVYLKQEMESLSRSKEKDVLETGKKGDIRNNKSSKETAGKKKE